MRPIARKVALVAVSAVLVACSVETGTVVVSVTCEGDGCGHEGDLVSRVEDCDEGTASYGEKIVQASFGTSGSYTFSFENVLDGERCVQAFLDVDTNGELSAGDVVSSDAVAAGVDEDEDDDDQELDDDPELDVDVEDDQTVDVDVVLDTLVAPEL